MIGGGCATSKRLPVLFLLLLVVLSSVRGEEAWLQPAAWVTTSIAQADGNMGATSVGNLALFAGGSFYNGFTTVPTLVNIYDAVDQSWTTADLSVGRFGVQATSVGHLALFAGGFVPTPEFTLVGSDVVDIFNQTDGSWTTTNLTQPRDSMGVTSVGDVALFAGGYRPGIGDIALVDIYNVTDGSWTTAELTEARSFIGATSVGNLALFAGGSGFGPVSTATVDIYNASNGSWTTANLSQARSMVAATSVGNIALFAGGLQVGSVMVGVVDIYNATDGSWTTANLTEARYYIAATSVGDVAIFAGGLTGAGPSTVIDIYNVTDGSWTTTNLSKVRYEVTATSVGNVVLFVGGEYEQNRTVDVYRIPFGSDSGETTTTEIREGGTTPELRFGSFGSNVLLTPKDNEGVLRVEMSVGLGFGENINEVNGNGSIVAIGSFNPLAGFVQVAPDLGAHESFLYSSSLRLNGSDRGEGKVMVQFYLFEDPTTIPVGDHFALHADPTYAKFTVRVMDWRWSEGSENNNSSLVWRIKVVPPFTHFTRRSDWPVPGTTTFALGGQFDNSSSAAVTQIRFASVAEVDGEVRDDVVRFELDAVSSAVVLTISRFNSTFIYDPDLGVLFAKSKGQSEEQLALIIGVSVAGVIALVVVVAVVVSSSIIIWKKHKRFTSLIRPTNMRTHVNFVYDDI